MGEWFHVDLTQLKTRTDVVLSGVVTDAYGQVVSRNVIPLQTPGSMDLPKANVTFTVDSSPTPSGTYTIALTSDSPALWVVLTTLAHGRFSDNAFLLTRPAKVDFYPFINGQG